MTDETKKPDEIDQAALDAHPEEQQGNDAGGASSDEQSQDNASAPAATAGDAGEQGNVDGTASSAESNTTTTEPESKSASDAGTNQTTATSQASSLDLGADAGNAAGAATDGAQQAGDAPVGGGEPLPLGAGGVIVPVADHVPEDDAQLAAADKVGATVETDSGNVVAGGTAPAVVTASPSSDTPTIDPNSDEHPLKTRARWLRMKFEAEEAVVMEHIVALLRDIEETL